MSRLERRNLNQKAVLWRAYGTDVHGMVMVEPPVELSVRWEEVIRQASAPNGETVSITADVWLDQVVQKHSIMRLGTLESLSATPDNLMQVFSYEGTPDIKGRTTQHSVSLVRFSNTLPEEVGTAN